MKHKFPFQKHNWSNAKIDYFEFNFPMIKKTANEILSKQIFRGITSNVYWSLREIRNIRIQKTIGWNWNQRQIVMEFGRLRGKHSL